MQLRDHTFLGTTQSLCPQCLRLVTAKIVVRDGGRVYFRKRCPVHGLREDFVCSDVRLFDRMEFSLPGKLPPVMGAAADRGCPFDCGLCTEHEQHTCVGLVEITSSCNLACPMCYAHSGPGGQHLSLDECKRSIDRLVQVEGEPEVLQLSGGEPTIHPQFAEILEYAVAQPILVVMINTNGIRLAHEPALVEFLAAHRKRVEVYLQFDGLTDAAYLPLRGEPLAAIKLQAVEALGRHGIRTTLVTTLQPHVNDQEIGQIVRYALARPWVCGLSLQPATYSGRFVTPETLEERITFPDVIRMIAEQTGGLFVQSDFLPLPCAHPNCHSLSYAYRSRGEVIPLARFIDAAEHLDLLANGITFTRPMARELIETYLGRQGCCAGGDCGTEASKPAGANGSAGGPQLVDRGFSLPMIETAGGAESTKPNDLAAEFFQKALAEKLGPQDVFRITITSFLDAYNFDVRRLMKCCIHHVLPSGHVIPFCAYNVLYRDGHVPLPLLAAAGLVTAPGRAREGAAHA